MSGPGLEAVRLEVYRHLFTALAEEMGATLRRSAYSPNIKERRDYSCAIFDGRGRVVAMGDHMPVHLGALPLSVAAALEELGPLGPGDVAALNDPFRGGTHLPDITLIAPVWVGSWGVGGGGTASEDWRGRGDRVHGDRRNREAAAAGESAIGGEPLAGAPPRPLAYLAARAHHADVGGMTPGSMPLAREIYQEGLRVPPVRLVAGGRRNEDLWRVLLSNVRTPAEREGDLSAQWAALVAGAGAGGAAGGGGGRVGDGCAAGVRG